MQRKKLLTILLGLAILSGLVLACVRFWMLWKQTGRGGTHVSSVPYQGQSSYEEYQALSKKMGLLETPKVIETGYKISPEEVTFAGTLIRDADVSTFQDLGGSYGKDASHIYFKGRIVPKADHDSFRVKADTDEYSFPLTFIAEDKNAIFVEDKALDVSKEVLFLEFYTFPSLQFLDGTSGYDSSWAVFNNQVYYYFLDTYGNTYNAIDVLKGVLPEKVQFIRDSQSDMTRYITDGNDIYYTNIKLEGADVKSFKVGRGYATDNRHVYIGEHRLKNADPATFVIDASYMYAHDAQHVYYDAKLIEGADVNTFRRVGDSYQYARDKKHVYYHGVKIPAADPSTFVEVGSVCNYGSYVVFGKDRDTIFRDGDRMEGLDPKTFEIVDEWYVRDAHTILRCGTERVADMNEHSTVTEPTEEKKSLYTVVGNNYETDNQGKFYYRGYEKDTTGKFRKVERLIDRVDGETFAPFGNMSGWATDKNSVYWNGKVVGSK